MVGTNGILRLTKPDKVDRIILLTERYNMNKKIKAEYLPGGAKRQELLDQVPKYLQTPGFQGHKHLFCMDVLKLTETEYLEALNKATNGAMLEELWK